MTERPDTDPPQPHHVYGASINGGTFYGPVTGVEINNHGPVVDLGILLHDHTGFMHTRLEGFVGRAAELAEIQRRIAELLPGGGYLTITGQAGQGKSSVIAKLVERALQACAGAVLPVAQLAERAGAGGPAYHFIPFQPGPGHQIGLLRNLMARLILKYGLSPICVASESGPALRDLFPAVLRDVAAKGGQEVIYIDGLDQIEEELNGQRDLSFLPPCPPPGILFVLGTRPNDTLTPLELRRPHSQYDLPDLGLADFDLILQHHGVRLDTALATRFYTAMEGNALYLNLVAQELAQAGALPPEQIIARVAENPDALFSFAIERLQRLPDWEGAIGPILGLLLVARQPLHERAVRALIGQSHVAVQHALRRLGGLVARDGEGRATLFHLKLRDFLREDPARPAKPCVFATDEEQQWHRRLADWAEQGSGLAAIWQDKSGDALEQGRRTYARLHYLAHLCLAREWSRLWDVLDAGDYASAKLRHDPSTRSLVQDLDLVRQQMVVFTQGDFATGLQWLPRLWRYSLLRCSLASRADALPYGLFAFLAKQGRIQEAIGLAEVQTVDSARVLALNQIGRQLAREGRTVEAQQIVLRAHAIVLLMPASDVAAGVAVVAESLALAGQPDTALGLARSIEPSAVRVKALEAVAIALAKAGRLEAVRACAADAQAAARSIADIPSRVLALLTAANALMFAQRADAALECVLEARGEAGLIQDAHQRVGLLGELVKALVAIGQHDAARNCVDQGFRAIAAIKNSSPRGLALAMLADAAVLVGQGNRLLDAVRLIGDMSVRASVLLEAVTALAKRGQPQAALDLAGVIEQTDQRAQALVAVAAALLQAGRRDEARARATEALDAARLVDNAFRRNWLLADVAEVLAGLGQINTALDLARSLDQASKRIPALWMVAEGLVLIGQVEQAKTCVDEATKQARSIGDADVRTQALLALARALVDAGGLHTARTCLVEATAAARLIEDTTVRDTVLLELVAALVRAGQPDMAEEVARSDGASEAAVQQRLAIAAQATFLWKDTTPLWARSFADSLQPSQALTVEVEALLSAGQSGRARARALRASEAARSVKKAGKRVWMLLDVIDALIKTGQTDAARTCAAEAGAAAQTLKNSKTRALMLQDAAAALAKTGEADPALELVRLLPEAETHAHTLVIVVQELVQQGQISTGLRVARTIEEESYRSVALLAVAGAQAQASKAMEARRCTAEALGLLTQDDSWRRVSLLKHAAAVAGRLPAPTALAFFHDHWPLLCRRNDLLALLPAAAPLVVARPQLLQELLDGFEWVDRLLNHW